MAPAKLQTPHAESAPTLEAEGASPVAPLSRPGAWQSHCPDGGPMAQNDVPRVELTTDTGVGLFEIMTLHSRLGG
jgi:hypothetical protein